MFMSAIPMGEFRHLVIVKFKEGAAVEEVIEEMEKMVSEVDLVKSCDRGQDLESPEMLTQGFSHCFSLTFAKKEDYVAFQTHPTHVKYASKFSAAVEKLLLFDFPVVHLKPQPA